MCAWVWGKNGRGSFISCHGKLTVYLKEFTHYHLKSNAGSLTANIKQDDRERRDSLPRSHPQIYFKDLSENLFSLYNSTGKHNHHWVLAAYLFGSRKLLQEEIWKQMCFGRQWSEVHRKMCDPGLKWAPEKIHVSLWCGQRKLQYFSYGKKNHIVKYTKINSPSSNIYWETIIISHYQRSTYGTYNNTWLWVLHPELTCSGFQGHSRQGEEAMRRGSGVIKSRGEAAKGQIQIYWVKEEENEWLGKITCILEQRRTQMTSNECN